MIWFGPVQAKNGSVEPSKIGFVYKLKSPTALVRGDANANAMHGMLYRVLKNAQAGVLGVRSER